jgi:hypothetical protein
MEQKFLLVPDETPETIPSTKRRMIYIVLGFIVLIMAMGFVYRSITIKNNEIKRLNQVIVSREEEQKKLNSYINEITDTITEVETKLRDVRSRQVSITGMIIAAENDSTKKGRIMNDISAVEDQLKKDKNDISDLQNRMKKSAVRITALENIVTTLRTEIDRNTKIMSNLRASLKEKDQVIKTKDLAIKDKEDTLAVTKMNLSSVANKLNQANQVLDETRNTGYFVIGIKKDLIEKKVLKETGGFLQRKNIILAPEIDSSFFTKIHILKITEFSISSKAKDVELIPPKSQNTFQIEDTGKNTSVLRVLNTEEFWKMPYLVILVKK